jgi:cytochrome c oxidase cbb3-type subunit 3
MKKTLLSITSLALSALLIPMQAAAQGTNAFKGHELFDTYCFVCHGTSGKGDGPLAPKLQKQPANLTDKARMSKRSEKALFNIVKGTDTHNINGVMPKWGQALSDPDIKALVAYLHFLSNSAEALPGDPHRGEAIYARHCSACHGVRGRGDGVMANILPMKPADHTQAGAVAKMSNQQMMAIISEGKGGYMPGWKELLSAEEIAAVSSYIRLLSY